MNKALWISATAMQNQQRMTDVIANNMANVNTTAYKRSVTHFEDMMYMTLSSPGATNSQTEAPVGIQIGSGVRLSSVSKNFAQGTYQITGRDLDLAIGGSGFFKVTMDDGTIAYTRDGKFHIGAGGVITTADGKVVEFPAAINNDTVQITITKDGNVTQVSGNGTMTSSGQINLYRFTNEEGLNSIGQNLYMESDSSGTATAGTPANAGFGNLLQGQLEGSNVEIVKEMVDMIASQRAYELNSKSIKTADEMLRMINSLK